MQNLYYVALGLLLLLQIPLAASGQNAVQTAENLRQVQRKIHLYPKSGEQQYNADTLMAYSRLFFNILATNDTVQRNTVDLLREKYATKNNTFLGPAIEEVYKRFEEATTGYTAQAQELNAVAEENIRVAQLVQKAMLDYLAMHLNVPLGMDTIPASRTELLAFRQLYNVATGSEAPLNITTENAGVVSRTIKDTISYQFKLLFNGFATTARGGEKHSELDKRLRDARNGSLRQALLSYFSSQPTVANHLDSLYNAVRKPYTRAWTLKAASNSKKDQRAEAQQIVISSLGHQVLTPAFNMAPSISLPITSAALTRGSTPLPGAVSAEGAIIDGTARFLADRLKQELNATFFQHFATLLHDSAYVELQLLFPSTARLLTSGSADYSTVVQTLRGTFERDLRELLFNYGTLLESQKFYAGRFGLTPAAGRVLQFTYAGSRTLYYLTHGAHPADLISRLQQDLKRNQLLPVASPLANTLSLAEGLSMALVDGNTLTRQWLTVEKLNTLLRNPDTRELMLGLLLERARPYLAQAPDLLQPTRFRPLALEFVALSGQLQDQAVALREQATKGRLRANDFVPLYQTMQRSLEWAATNGDLLALQLGARKPALTATELDERKRQLQARLALYRNISDAVLQGYVAADTGDYGVTLSNLLDVVLLSLGQEKSPTGGGNNEKDLNIAARLSQLPQPARTQLLSLPQIVRYGSFMAAVAQAKTSEDVKEALEAAALPVGSASIKRRSFSSISINAFAGVTTGLEYAYLTEAQRVKGIGNVNSTRFNVGPTAPIGLSFSWGTYGYSQPVRRRALLLTTGHVSQGVQRLRVARARRLDQAYRYYDIDGKEKYLRGAAWGLFVSVIDLGVPVLLRFNDDKSTTLPANIGFRQVLAPGLFGMYHLRGMPLTLFAGGQYTPQLRELRQVQVPQGEPAPDARNSIRFNVGLTVDIPLFQLYTRTAPKGESPQRILVERVARRDAQELDSLRRILQDQQLIARARTQHDSLTQATKIFLGYLTDPQLQRASKELDTLLQNLQAAFLKPENAQFKRANQPLLDSMKIWVPTAQAIIGAIIEASVDGTVPLALQSTIKAANLTKLTRIRVAILEAETAARAKAAADARKRAAAIAELAEKQDKSMNVDQTPIFTPFIVPAKPK